MLGGRHSPSLSLFCPAITQPTAHMVYNLLAIAFHLINEHNSFKNIKTGKNLLKLKL